MFPPSGRCVAKVSTVKAEPPKRLLFPRFNGMAYPVVFVIFNAEFGMRESAVNVHIGMIVILLIPRMRLTYADIAAQVASPGLTYNKAGQARFFIRELFFVGLLFPQAVRPLGLINKSILHI